MVDLSSAFGTSVDDAVSTSISTNKPLIVYITAQDLSSENEWVDSFMTQELLDLIQEKSVTLKLYKNTAECQLFEQIFPNVLVPSIFCIKVSAVLDVIHGDINKNEFETRIRKALEDQSFSPPFTASSTSQSQFQSQHQQNSSEIQPRPQIPTQPQHQSSQAQSQLQASDQPSESHTNNEMASIQPLPNTQATSLLPSQSQPQSQPQSQSQSRSQSQSSMTAMQSTAPQLHQVSDVITSSSSSPSPSPSPAHPLESQQIPKKPQKEYRTLKEQASAMAMERYRKEQLKKKKVEQEERERVRKLLKADEEERKLNIKIKNQERERMRRLSNGQEIDDSHKIDEIIHEQQTLKDNVHRHNKKKLKDQNDEKCVLSIKLLNGMSLRHSFKVRQTLSDVRRFVDDNRTDGNEAYCFHRTIPRTTFDVDEEVKSLESLELVPRSALILKPSADENHSTGSDQNSNSGIFSRILGGLSSFWSAPTTRNTSDSSRQQSIRLEGDEGHLSAINESSEDSANPNQSISHTGNINPHHDLLNSQTSSQFVSPNQSPNVNVNLNTNTSSLDLLHPTALSLNLNVQDEETPTRPLTPQTISESPLENVSRSGSSQLTSRFRTLNSSFMDDRTTYNGNHTNLEDDKK